MVAVVAHLRGQIERHAQPGLPLGEQIAIAGVGLVRAAEARVLPHGPQPAAVAVGLDAAGERVLPRVAQIALGLEALGGERGGVVQLVRVAAADARRPGQHAVARSRVGLRRRALRVVCRSRSSIGHGTKG
jgi:hypothetical protein